MSLLLIDLAYLGIKGAASLSWFLAGPLTLRIITEDTTQ